MRRIVIIDDDQSFLDILTAYVHQEYPLLEISCYNDPLKSLPEIDADIDLLLIDLEMPGLDGTKVLSYACQKGLSKQRIIILSNHDAEYLHQRSRWGNAWQFSTSSRRGKKRSST